MWQHVILLKNIDIFSCLCNAWRKVNIFVLNKITMCKLPINFYQLHRGKSIKNKIFCHIEVLQFCGWPPSPKVGITYKVFILFFCCKLHACVKTLQWAVALLLLLQQIKVANLLYTPICAHTFMVFIVVVTFSIDNDRQMRLMNDGFKAAQSGLWWMT